MGNDENTGETPLLDLLRGMPEDRRVTYQYIDEPAGGVAPIGHLCHRAADKIEELEQEVAVFQRCLYRATQIYHAKHPDSHILPSGDRAIAEALSRCAGMLEDAYYAMAPVISSSLTAYDHQRDTSITLKAMDIKRLMDTHARMWSLVSANKKADAEEKSEG